VKALGYVGWALFAWLVVAQALFHDLRTQERKEVRRFVEAVCSEGFPPQQFHTEALDRTLEGELGPELLEGCGVQRRRFEEAVQEEALREGIHWQSEVKEASWR
jgi:hypothetical protein